jgi:protein SCO1/2
MAEPPPDYVPPPWLVFLRKHIWVISFFLAIITITAIRPFMRHIPDPPPKLYALPDYTLVDHHERPFTPDTLRGKVWVAAFVFTRCPSSCPAVTRAMLDLRDRFDRNDIDVELVSISVDPVNDTPAVLAAHADEVGAEHEHWRFVTGDLGAIQSLAEDGFRLGIGPRTEEAGGLYDIAHSTKLALVDQDGTVRGFYGIDPTPNVDGGLDELYERADRVVMEAREG